MRSRIARALRKAASKIDPHVPNTTRYGAVVNATPSDAAIDAWFKDYVDESKILKSLIGDVALKTSR